MAANANTLIYDRAVDRAAMIRLYEKRLKNKVELVINGHITRVDKLIRDADTSPAGFIRLREAVDNELRKTYSNAKSVSERGLLDLFTDQVSYAYQNLEVAAGNIWKTERPARRLAEDVVLHRPLYNDQTLEQG